MELIIAFFLVGFVCGLLGVWIAGAKGRSSGVGFLIGFLFGPLGCLILVLTPSVEGKRTGQRRTSPTSSSRAMTIQHEPNRWPSDNPSPPSRMLTRYASEEMEPGEMPKDWDQGIS